MGSGDYRETHVSDQSTYIERIYINKREQASSERQAPPKRNKIQKALLDWVKNEVESRLKNSLHNRVSILLEKEEDPTQVNPPWAIDVKIGTGQPFRLPSDTTIADIYDREDIKGRLLILGAPGSGKTTTLLQLAQVLINRAEEDVNQPFPVLLNLSSWKDDKQSIKDWIIADLKLKYGVRKDIGQKWLEKAVIIPLLDGLDELSSARQSLGVERINQFLQPLSWSKSLVVCSRSEEYQRAATQLGLNGSIVLQPLNQEKIRDYVLRTEGEQLWDIIKDDPSFMNLAQTPLLLTIMVISCEKISFYKWQKLESLSKRLSYLFDTYIDRMFSRKYSGKQPIADKSRHWLGWLAVQLEEQNKTEFLIESMQPYWLKTKKKMIIFWLIFWLIFSLIFGLISWLFFWLIRLSLRLIRELIFSLILRMNFELTFWYMDIRRLIFSLIFSLIFGLIFGLIVVLSGWLIPDPSDDKIGKWSIEPVETLSFSLEKFREGLIIGLTVGLTVGLGVGLCFGMIASLSSWLIFGLIVVLGVGLIAGLVRGLSGSEIDLKIYPNQGIKKSVKNAIILPIALTTMLILIESAIQVIVVLNNFFNLSEFWVDLEALLFSILLCLIIGSVFKCGGLPAIKHFSLRVVLWFSGYIPWNYARFLDYATNRLFLQRVGGGYRFIHRLLQEHFAQMYSDKP